MRTIRCPKWGADKSVKCHDCFSCQAPWARRWPQANMDAAGMRR